MNELTLGFISIAVLVAIQIGLFAYGYGKISQKVEGNINRIIDIEGKIDKIWSSLSKMDSRVDKMEINIAKLEVNMTKFEVSLTKMEITTDRLKAINGVKI